MDSQGFVAALRTALMQLDDLQSLRHSPLLNTLARNQGVLTPIELQGLLADAIDHLKRQKIGHASLLHEVLYYRFVEQLGQEELAYQLGMSVRQLRRKQADAIESLAAYLWEQYGLSESAITASANEPLLIASPAGEAGWDDELAWLRRGFPEDVSNAHVELLEAVKAAAALAKQYRVTFAERGSTQAVLVGIPPPVLRQALLAVLTGVVVISNGAVIEVTSEHTDSRLAISVCVIIPSSETLPISGDQELPTLQAAARLLVPFGGEVSITTRSPLSLSIQLQVLDKFPVMVIDDNPDARELLKRYAANTRFHIIATDALTDVPALALATGAQVIVLDVMMPGVDGWDVLSRLHHHPGTHEIPVVIHSILPQKAMALVLGAERFLQKPVTRQEFLSVLDELATRRVQGPG